MSWFDATELANLAKSALKEAQKTIEKALDIKEEDQKLDDNAEDTSDFFASWGLKSEENNTYREKCKSSKQETGSSVWGSFTGSFFESPSFNEAKGGPKRITHSKSLQHTSFERPQFVSSSSFSDNCKGKDANRDVYYKYSDNHLKQEGSAEDIVEGDHCRRGVISASSSNTNARLDEIANENVSSESRDGIGNWSDGNMEIEDANKVRLPNETEAVDSDETIDAQEAKKQEISISEEKLNANDHALNQASLVLSESDKKSMESVEILGSRSNTDCTTTPESDGHSISNSVSPSTVGGKMNSESVEILPDSLVTSPSSVEILGDWKTADNSPYLSPLDPRRSNSSSVLDRDDSITPCWEDINVAHVTTWSSSDISLYEPPLDGVQTPHGNSCSSSADSTPSMEAYPSAGTQSLSKLLSTVRTTKPSTESVEDPILATDEPDEASFAEDSYTSVSESTVATILETFQQMEQSKSKLEIPINFSSSGKTNDSCLNSDLDTPKEKHNLHLPIEAITRQPIRNADCFDGATKKPEVDRKSFDRLLNATIEPADTDGQPVDQAAHHSFKSSVMEIGILDVTAEQHLISTDSSCEGTLIESSSEDNPPIVHQSEEKVSKTPLTGSSYVKTMLADAMIEKGSDIVDLESQQQTTEIPRENSPISSESRSDLVKIGSDQTSGHTSGDELETTTSSDIEIISSPNGDSSSTQSRQSLTKFQAIKAGDLLTKALKTRGHSRELSEISVGSDDANLEIEKLLKRIQEMTEILEARESKLIDVSRMNMELHEQNAALKRQLDNFEKHAEQSENLNQITDEYTQRLSALERKFQQAIRERDSLRKNLEQLKVEAATRLSSQEMYTLSAEKDEIIKELREEGEKLSKQQLQHSNIIKRLRVKEKENDALIKSQKEQIEEQILELERLKRSLHAKEEVERTQIEAVHTLTAKTKKQEKEIFTLQEKLDNTTHKMDAYKKSLDAAKIDLIETKQILVATEAELKNATTSAGETCQLLAQVEELKIKLRESEETHVKKEEYLKHENVELLKRLEAAEARSEELSESVSTATKPLLRQLEQLQANLLHKTNNFIKQEKALSEKNIELQTKLENFVEMDCYLKEENISLKSAMSQLESKVAAKESERKQLQDLYEQLMLQNENLAEEKLRHQQRMESHEQSHSLQIIELKREIVALENKLSVEKAAADAERRKNHAISELRPVIETNDERRSPVTNEKQHSANTVDSIWPLENTAPENDSETYTTLYDSIRTGSSSTSIFENLQAQLKQKDGEIQQLQWELSRRNTERDALNAELSTLTLKIEELNNKVSDVAALNESLQEIQTRYDALLQMYGEKMEENQELRLDLEDIKEMYKTQIDQLLRRET